MLKWGIHLRVWFLALVPTLTLCCLLGAYFTNLRLQDLDHALMEQGLHLSRRLSLNLQQLYPNKDWYFIKQVAKCNLDPSIENISFYDIDGALITSAGKPPKHFLAIKPELNQKEPTISEKKHVISFTSRINLDKGNVLFLRINVLRAPTQVKQYHVLLQNGVIILIAFLMSSVLAYFMSLDVARPIKSLSKRLLGYQLETSHRQHDPAFSFASELSLLEVGIEELLEALIRAKKTHQVEIQSLSSDCQKQLRERDAQVIQLSHERRKADRASQAKSRFLANMSHEIRTPLNGVIGFINLLSKSTLSARQKDYLNVLQNSSATLLNIINEILDFSKIEAGQLRLHMQSISLADAIEEVLEMLAPSAQTKGLELIPELDPLVPERVLLDPLRLKQILINLINNAIKYTECGHIRIKVQLMDADVEHCRLLIHVIDTGIGLSLEEQKKLFDAFYQGSSSREGTGLGLSITKNLVEQLQGEIFLESQLGQGSDFSFSFKVARDLSHPLAQSQPLREVRILVSEPIDASRRAYVALLENWGAVVESFVDLATLVQNLEHLGPWHLALLGLAQTSHLSQETQAQLRLIKAHGPIGVLINSSCHHLQSKILALGAVFSLVKPVPRHKLLESICQTLLPQTDSQAHTCLNEEPRLDPNLRILTVDDNPNNLKLVCALLDAVGVQATPVSSAKAAIALSEHQVFDLILMDLQMPEMDGYAATRQIRALANGREVPILALTAHVLSEEQDKVIASGMNGFISKPIQEQTLYQLIAYWTDGDKMKMQADTNTHEAPAIDWPRAYQITAQNKALAHELMEKLVAEFGPTLTHIQQLWQARDLQALGERVHRLHGGCAYCGVPVLKEKVKLLEHAIKQNPDDLEPLIDAVAYEIDRVLVAWEAESRTNGLSSPP